MYKLLKLHHVAMFTLLVLFILAAGQPINDTDMWWHLRAGQYIWQSAEILKADPFSFSNTGHIWIAHEWLAELIYFLLYKAGNFYGLIIGNAVILSIILTLLYRLTLLRTGRPFLSAVLVMITLIMSSVFWAYRPHMLGYVCFLAFLFLLELYKSGNHRVLWFLPAIMVFWVNVHGSYIIGLVLIALYLMAGLVKKDIGRIQPEPWSKQQLGNLACCLAVSFLVTLLNPNTYRIIIYPFYTIGNSNIINKINEWASPDFHEPIFLVFLGVVLAGLALVTISGGKHRVADLLLIGCFTGLAFFAVRNIALYLFACIPVMGRYLADLVRPGQEGKQLYPLNWIVAAAVIFGVLILWPSPNELSVHQNESVFPAGAVKYMNDNNISGKIFNDYNWGGYLLWFRFPQNRVFIDGRTDIYSDRVYPDYLKIMSLAPESLKLLDKYKPDLILVRSRAAINEILKGRPDWKVVYRDEESVLYKKLSVMIMPGHTGKTIKRRQLCEISRS